MYNIFKTTKEKHCIFIENNEYFESNNLKNETLRVWCANKKFNVSVLVCSNIKSVLRNK